MATRACRGTRRLFSMGKPITFSLQKGYGFQPGIFRGWAMALALVMAVLLAPRLWAQQDLVVGIQVHNNRRIPAETVKARVFTHVGDVYDEAALERDFNSLWNTGYFEDIRMEREQSAKGWIIHIYVKERPTIREISYVGLNAVTNSDVLDRFKDRKVGLTQESQYDPTRIKKAEVALKELLGEHGRQFATVRTEVRPIPPASVAITFVVKEGPKVKVGRIRFVGNRNLNARTLRTAMKNLKPIGIPHSIFLGFSHVQGSKRHAWSLPETLVAKFPAFPLH